MDVATLSVLGLALAVAVSCFTKLNVGVLAVGLAWLIGVYAGGMPVNQVMSGFPSSLFLTLVGVTLLFAIAQGNGTLDRLAHRAVRSCRGHRGIVPMMFFVLAATLASMGPGNIATAALIAPMAMATAAQAGIPLFLMAIMVGNGANAGSLSPFAPTGIIVNGLRTMIREGRGRGLPVFVGTLTPQRERACRGYAPAYVPAANDQIRALAASEGASLVDLYQAFGGVAGDLIGPDGLHPNEAGYQRIADAFFAAIRERLEK